MKLPGRIAEKGTAFANGVRLVAFRKGSVMSIARSKLPPMVSELAGDAELADILEIFVAELPSRIRSVEEALNAADYATIGRMAHQLKGSAGGYGFPVISEVAGILEKHAAASTDVAAITEQVRRLADLCASARAR